MLRSLLQRLSGARAGAAAPQQPADAPAWKAQGNAALAEGRLDEAVRCYEQGVRAQADDASLRLNLGFVLLQQGRPEAAAERLQQALAMRRAQDGIEHEAFYLLGCAHAAQGRLEDALAGFAAALRAKPDFVEPMEAGLQAARQLGRHDEAAGWARQLAEHRPGIDPQLALARALLASGRKAEAAERLQQLCADAPDHVEAAYLHYQALWELGRLEDALAQAERVLALTGPNAGALANVGAVLEKLDRLDEALARLEEALRLEPGNPGALLNRVAVLMELGRVAQARDAAREALRHCPEDANLHWNLGISHLLLGELREGWEAHEWRSRSDAVTDTAPRYTQPPWRGEDLPGRTLLVYGEQGFGDNIQFVRYVPELARRARAVLLQVPPALEPLVQGLAPNCRLLHAGELLPDFDFHCPLMSLPARLGTTLQSVPAAVPYLRADPARARAWRDRLGSESLNVGIAWSGRPTHANDRRRSMRLETFRGLSAPGCRFVTLQPQLPQEDRAALAAWPQVLDVGHELRDFADSAALVDALDLVVSVDTSVAHLAGALGKPVWVLLPFVPDWRWLLEGEASPWYPSARLFRQDATRRWEPVLQRVREALRARAATAPA